GYPVLRELTLRAPLPLDRGAVQLHVVVGDEQHDGRSIRIYSCAGLQESEAWTLHAEGRLARSHTSRPAPAPQAWPPVDAIPLDRSYETLGRRGYLYGPVFQGLNRLWRAGDDIYAEVRLPGGVDVLGYGIHPALLDATLHSVLLSAIDSSETPLPYTWIDVALHAKGATSVRVHVTATGVETYAVHLTDPAGQPVLSGTLRTRPSSAEQLATTLVATRPLHHIHWTAKELVDPGTVGVVDWASVDEAAEGSVVVLWSESPDAGRPDNPTSATSDVLTVLQHWLGRTRLERSILLVITSGAVDVDGTEAFDPIASAVWGLVRAAQTEHPGRFVLLDALERDIPETRLAAIALAGEPEVALRDGQARVPRLRTLPVPDNLPSGRFGNGTVLITGGTGGLGSLVAQHLVHAHGVRHLTLISRRGSATAGARDLMDRLAVAGAAVEVVECDVTDRAELAHLLTRLQVSAVIHLAGVLDDALVENLTTDSLARVLAPKASGAWHLHELTAESDLAAFIVFSSAAGVLGGAGQGNYAAANRYLDGLIAYRRSRGLPGVSIAWGLWSEATAMTAHLSTADADRLRGWGMAPLSTEHALELLDSALAADPPLVIATHLDTSALRIQQAEGTLPPALSLLVPNQRAHAAVDSTETGLRQRLAELDPARRYDVVLDLCRANIAAVLGHGRSGDIEEEQSFKALGFDSLAAVQFRNRLSAATQLTLPVSVIFDHPTPRALTRFLITELIGDVTAEPLSAPAVAHHDEPLAVVGMGCRFPGGVVSPEDLWRVVAEGRDVVGEFPVDRGWDVADLYDPRPGVAGKSYTRSGGFLEG
ncbi:SDR family NAD(P)-dependent oxidoreductase, partial [Nocardia sp. NPDC048505]|uniref:type I polyketide synthase n=1 Tax=Nocardia sp. NPDC048505 TaxID=3155756 RepID=UPI0033E2FFDB